jgi:hypothetical protein
MSSRWMVNGAQRYIISAWYPRSGGRKLHSRVRKPVPQEKNHCLQCCAVTPRVHFAVPGMAPREVSPGRLSSHPSGVLIRKKNAIQAASQQTIQMAYRLYIPAIQEYWACAIPLRVGSPTPSLHSGQAPFHRCPQCIPPAPSRPSDSTPGQALAIPIYMLCPLAILVTLQGCLMSTVMPPARQKIHVNAANLWCNKRILYIS